MLKSPNSRLFLALLLACGMLLYTRRVLVPYQRGDAAVHNYPRGNLSDLYPRWLGARELLLHGRDPYSAEITREIQIGYYGRALDPSRPGDPRDSQAFAYPLYVVFLLAPTVLISFKVLRPIFYVILVLVEAATVIAWLRALRWSPSKAGTAALILLSLATIPVIQAIELQQLTLVVAALLAGCALLLVKGKFATAGIFLAICTIKPQLILPVAAWLTLWAAGEWGRRKNFVIGFYGAMAILLTAGEWVQPGWIAEFWRAGKSYLEYTNASPLLNILTNPGVGPILTGTVWLLTALFCYRWRRESERSARFLLAFILVLATTLVSIPTISTYNHVLMLPGVLVLLSQGREVWAAKLMRPTVVMAGALIIWPWLAALGLGIASFFLPGELVQHAWKLPFYTGIVTPLVILGLMVQYSLEKYWRHDVPEART